MKAESQIATTPPLRALFISPPLSPYRQTYPPLSQSSRTFFQPLSTNYLSNIGFHYQTHFPVMVPVSVGLHPHIQPQLVLIHISTQGNIQLGKKPINQGIVRKDFAFDPISKNCICKQCRSCKSGNRHSFSMAWCL